MGEGKGAEGRLMCGCRGQKGKIGSNGRVSGGVVIHASQSTMWIVLDSHR